MAPACCGLCHTPPCTSPHTSASGRCCWTWWRASSGGRKQSALAHSSHHCRPALQVAHGQMRSRRQRGPCIDIQPRLWLLSGMLNSVPAGVAGQHRQVSPVLDLVAGSAAGATAVLLTYPLDLVCQRSLMTACPQSCIVPPVSRCKPGQVRTDAWPSDGICLLKSRCAPGWRTAWIPGRQQQQRGRLTSVLQVQPVRGCRRAQQPQTVIEATAAAAVAALAAPQLAGSPHNTALPAAPAAYSPTS